MTPDIYLLDFARAVRDMQTKEKAYFHSVKRNFCTMPLRLKRELPKW